MTIQSTATSAVPTSAQTTSTVPANPSGDMGVDTFMKLLVAELKNQDPNQPMDAREMVTQLSQLTGVEKLSDMDQKLTDLSTANTAANSVQSAGLIGKTVSADAHNLNLSSGKNPTGNYQVQGAANSVKVQISDSAGKLIRTVTGGAQSPGPRSFLWDGKDDVGMRVPDGTYTFAVTAQDAKGIPVATSTQVSGLVTEVTYESGAPEVVVGGAQVPLADVTSIAQ
jgi:flagellar basal-body rod modification protein FlgD